MALVYFSSNLCLQEYKLYILRSKQNNLLQRKYSTHREARHTLLHRGGGKEMETRRRRGNDSSKTPPRRGDTLTVLMLASNITVDPDSLHHWLSGGQCCLFIRTPYQTIITLEDWVELCSATSGWSRQVWF